MPKAAFIVGFFTLASRVAGLVRDRLFASTFGAGDTLDAYYAAFRIPDFVFNLLILGTLSVAFIPIFSELLITDRARAYKTANSVLNSTFLGMAVLCLALMLAAKPLTHALVPGFEGVKFQDTLVLTRIFLLSPVIFTLSNVFSSILNAQKKFMVVGLAPILYNCGIIFGLLVLYPRYGLAGLGFGVVLGAMLHLTVQIPEAVRHGYVWRPALDLKDQAIKKISRLFVPRIFGMDNSQISLLIGSVVGSILASGSIAVFNLANNLQAVPLGIFAVSFSVAAFPLLSEEYAKNDQVGFTITLAETSKLILFYIIPFSVLMFALRVQIVPLAFQGGKFSHEDSLLTLQALGIFCASLFAQALIPLFARSFYARHNTTKPVIVNFFSMALNGFLAYHLGRLYGITGVVAAFSIAGTINFLILGFLIRKEVFKKTFDSILLPSVTKILFASIIMAFVAYGSLYIFGKFFNTKTYVGLFLQTGATSVFAALAYLLTASRLGLKDADNILNKLKFRDSGVSGLD